MEGKTKTLRDLLNLTRTDARGAHPEPPSGAVHQSANRLQIDVPAAFRHVVGVTDAVSELRAASTNLTNLRHKTEISLLLNSQVYQGAGNPGNCAWLWRRECT